MLALQPFAPRPQVTDAGREREFTDGEHLIRITWMLCNGEGLTTADVARITGYTRQGAYAMMCRISRVIPICQDAKHVWCVAFCKEAEN
jgi:hypothetical protein